MSTGMTAYVYTKDLARLRQFYEGALGVKAASHGDWLPFDLGGATFALHGVSADVDRDLHRFNISFEVDDIEAAVERFREHGAKMLRGVADETFGKRAVLQDPDGRTFELLQHQVP